MSLTYISVKRHLDHILRNCDFARVSVVSLRCLALAFHKFLGCRETIEELFLYLPLCEKGLESVWCCAILWDWGEQSNL